MAKQASLPAYVSRTTLLVFCIIGIVVTTLITAIRVFVRLSKQTRLHSDDYALFAAVGFYFALVGLYITDIPYLYTFFDYVNGKTAFSPDVMTDYAMMMKINFGVTTFFWCVLWSVKLSLLLFFRRVIRDTDWMRIWWVIAGFTGLTFIGCIVSEFTSCDSIKDFTVLGQCVSPGEQRAQIISLYYSFTADVLTELAVMALPLRVIGGLKLSRRDKISLLCLFSVGVIAIIVSMIRVFLIWAKTGSTTPSPAWLALWAVVECMVAIIVGCIPAISQAFRVPGSSTYHRSGSANVAPQYTYGIGPYTGSGPRRGRVSHISSPRQITTASEEELFDGIQTKTEITVKSDAVENEVELESWRVQPP